MSEKEEIETPEAIDGPEVVAHTAEGETEEDPGVCVGVFVWAN